MTKVYIQTGRPKLWKPVAAIFGGLAALTAYVLALQWWLALDSLGVVVTFFLSFIAYAAGVVVVAWDFISKSPWRFHETPVPAEQVPWALQFYAYARRRLNSKDIPKAIDAYAQALSEHTPQANGGNPALESEIEAAQKEARYAPNV